MNYFGKCLEHLPFTMQGIWKVWTIQALHHCGHHFLPTLWFAFKRHFSGHYEVDLVNVDPVFRAK